MECKNYFLQVNGVQKSFFASQWSAKIIFFAGAPFLRHRPFSGFADQATRILGVPYATKAAKYQPILK
jgi:hypothetical protein